MQDFLSTLLTAVITAVIPVISAFAVILIKKYAVKLTADTDSVKAQAYLTEIANAISDAVAATSQTYVDALKNTNAFTKDAQTEALQKALAVCAASISEEAKIFIETQYGDVTDYLTNKIEAEVRSQKLATSAPVTAILESTTDATAVAASAAAATAATYLQTAIDQLEEAVKTE